MSFDFPLDVFVFMQVRFAIPADIAGLIPIPGGSCHESTLLRVDRPIAAYSLVVVSLLRGFFIDQDVDNL